MQCTDAADIRNFQVIFHNLKNKKRPIEARKEMLKEVEKMVDDPSLGQKFIEIALNVQSENFQQYLN